MPFLSESEFGKERRFFVFYPFGAVSVTYPARCDRADSAFREGSDMSRAEPFRKRKNGEKGAVLNNSPGGSGILLKNRWLNRWFSAVKIQKKKIRPSSGI